MYCQLCGVSFNISRIRTRDEPRDAAWFDACGGGGWIEADASPVCREGDCSLVCRTLDALVRTDGPMHNLRTFKDDDLKDEEVLPLSTTYAVVDKPYPMTPGYEHIAGPGCRSIRGYHGDKISVEEMRGCTTVQCLMPKEEDWKPRHDDLDFEKESTYQLTGLAGYMPSGGSMLDLWPIRNHLDGISADNDGDSWLTV